MINILYTFPGCPIYMDGISGKGFSLSLYLKEGNIQIACI